MTNPLFVGAVAYTPNVVTIWEGIPDYFAGTETETDFALFPTTGGRSRNCWPAISTSSAFGARTR